MVALTATSAQWPLAAWASSTISRALPDVPIIAGGVHSTVATEEVISTSGVWAACRGEGEAALVEMLSRLEFGEWEETPGSGRGRRSSEALPYADCKTGRGRGTVPGEDHPKHARKLVDIVALPHPDRDIYDYQAILPTATETTSARSLWRRAGAPLRAPTASIPLCRSSPAATGSG